MIFSSITTQPTPTRPRMLTLACINAKAQEEPEKEAELSEPGKEAESSEPEPPVWHVATSCRKNHTVLNRLLQSSRNCKGML